MCRTARYRVQATGKVVSSRREGCTHALMHMSSGRVFSFYQSIEAALEGLRGWEALDHNDMYGRRVLETGRVWALGPTRQDAARNLAEHDRKLGQEGLCREPVEEAEGAVYRGARYYGFRATGRDMENARANESRRESWLKDVTIVTLEAAGGR